MHLPDLDDRPEPYLARLPNISASSVSRRPINTHPLPLMFLIFAIATIGLCGAIAIVIGAH